MTMPDVDQLIRAGDEQSIRRLAHDLYNKRNDPAGHTVVDGSASVKNAFEEAAKRKFLLQRQIMVGKTPVFEWLSPTQDIEAGAFVRNYYAPEGTASLHVVLASYPLTNGYSMGYSICAVRPYIDGVGLNGMEKPVAAPSVLPPAPAPRKQPA